MSTHEKTTMEREAGELLDHIKDYVETQSEITRLTVLEKGSQAAGTALGGFVIGFLFFLFFIFLGIGLAYVVAEFTGHTSVGFFSIAGLYLVAGILFAMNKEKWIQKPLENKIIKNYFEDHEDKED